MFRKNILAHKEECVFTLQKVLDKFKTIDFTIFSQGVAGVTPVGEVKEEQWDNIFNVNLKYAFFFAQEISKLMKKQKSGKIIFISSIHSTRTYKNRVVYAATKSALESVTYSMAIDLAEYNISVNAISPGQLMTEMQEKMIKQNSEVKVLFDNIKDKTPTKRFTIPEDVAEIAKMLLKIKTNQLTGTVINIDGGIRHVA